jgi:hypothetical protein
VSRIEPLAAGLVPNHREIVARNVPTVVGITSEESVKVAVPLWNDPLEWGIPKHHPFFQFFRELPAPRSSHRAWKSGS